MSLSPRLFYLPVIFATALTSACAALQSDVVRTPETLYESTVFTAGSGQRLAPPALAQALADADVIVVGEYHGHQGSHLLQAQLQAALYRQHPQQVLALESFEVDHQAVIDDYLAGSLGEEELIEDAGAWNNYKASYRPLVEFARHQQLPVIAANAPAGIVRCVGRQGPDYLEALAPARRTLLPEQPFPEVPGYRDRFFDAMESNDHGEASEANRERLNNAYHAQMLRDATMAEQVLRAWQQYPEHQVLMITGTFHSERRLGMVGVLEQRAPDLEVVVITPVTLDTDSANLAVEPHRGRGDYLYFVLPLPEQYRDDDRRNAAMKEQFSRAGQQDCQ